MKSYKLPIPTLPVLVIPDTHVPFEDRRSFKALFKYANTREWGGIIILGDFMDLDQLSRFSDGDARLIASRGLRKDFDLANQLLDKIDRIPCNSWKVYLKGNHEARTETFSKRLPQLEELISVPYNLGLKQRGWHWVDTYQHNTMTLQIGKANFIHGLYCSKYHAQRHVEDYGVNIFTGHTHDAQTYSKVRAGKDDSIVGASLGVMARHDLAYKNGKPDRWQQGFAIFDFHKNGCFNWQFVSIFNHRFKIDGVTYSG